MTPDQVEVIVEMYKDGASFREIGAEIGKTPDQVKYWMRTNRSTYVLTKRRSGRSDQGVLSEALWADSKWNVKLGVEFISKKWRLV
jgi:hypothetical protein